MSPSIFKLFIYLSPLVQFKMVFEKDSFLSSELVVLVKEMSVSLH